MLDGHLVLLLLLYFTVLRKYTPKFNYSVIHFLKCDLSYIIYDRYPGYRALVSPAATQYEQQWEAMGPSAGISTTTPADRLHCLARHTCTRLACGPTLRRCWRTTLRCYNLQTCSFVAYYVKNIASAFIHLTQNCNFFLNIADLFLLLPIFFVELSLSNVKYSRFRLIY